LQDMHLCSCFRSSAVAPDETYDTSGRDVVSVESEDSSDRPGHFLRGISCLYFADGFIKVISAGHDRNASVREVEADVIRKKGPDAAKSEFMLSYSWGYGVGSIADTLTDFLGSDEHKYVWICCLCINQHRVKEAQAAGHVVPFGIFRKAFSQRVEGVSHILARLPCSPHLFVLTLAPDNEKDAFRSALFASGRGLRELFEGLSKLRIQDAQASVPHDKEHIMQTIDKAAEATGQGIRKDFNKSPKVAALNQSVKEKLQTWFIATAAAWLEKKISSGDSVKRLHLDGDAVVILVILVGMKQHGCDGPVAAISIRLLGRMSIRKGDYSRAEQHYTHAMALLDACNLVSILFWTSCEDYARLLKHMGTVHLGEGDLMQVTLEDNWKALEAFEEARRIYQAEKLERPDTALTSFREACDVYDAVGASGLAVAQAYSKLGQMLNKAGTPEKAAEAWPLCATEAYGRAKKEYEACGEVDGPEYEEAREFSFQGKFPVVKFTPERKFMPPLSGDIGTYGFTSEAQDS
ncbi:unnamed protein product, partial [Cladocopium goreaui]